MLNNQNILCVKFCVYFGKQKKAKDTVPSCRLHMRYGYTRKSNAETKTVQRNAIINFQFALNAPFVFLFESIFSIFCAEQTWTYAPRSGVVVGTRV